MKKKALAILLTGVMLLGSVPGEAMAKETSRQEEGSVTWMMSQEGNYWQEQDPLTLTDWTEEEQGELYIDVDENITYQEMAQEVWGGCFNERGWQKLMMLSEKDRNEVLDLLFDPDKEGGLHMTMGRLPIGSSDYAIDLYSLDDVEDDYDLSEFSIERDRQYLIPYIKEALKRQPELKLWASPWSPPYWMKVEGNKIGGHVEYTEENMAAYGQYFRKFIEAYEAEGIHISMVSPQNEPTMNTGYSSCLWTGEQLRDFVKDHLGPALEGTGVEIYLGTFTNSDDSLVDPLLADPDAKEYISGITFQWWSYNKARSLYHTGFDLGMMQSETMCGDGRNNWRYAENQFDVMWMYLENGISAYNLWNMVLEWDGQNPGGVNTTGGWFQNAPITVNETTKEYQLNPHYYEYGHFTNFIEPGARRIESSGTYDADFPLADSESDASYSRELHEIAFRNPDGTNVLLVKNGSDSDKSVDIIFNGKGVSVTLPAHSIHTFTTQGTPLTGNETDMREIIPAEKIVTIQNAASDLVLCVDTGGVKSGLNLIQWPYGDQANQKWYLEPGSVNGMETIKLVNIKSESVAAVYGGSKNEGAGLILWNYEGNADQNWIAEQDEETGYYRFKNANSGLYLTMPDEEKLTQAVQMGRSNAKGQLWKVSTVTEKPAADLLQKLDDAVAEAEKLLGDHTQENPVYTQETCEALMQALEASRLVAENTNINEGRNDREAVLAAAKALQKAIEGLEKIPETPDEEDPGTPNPPAPKPDQSGQDKNEQGQDTTGKPSGEKTKLPRKNEVYRVGRLYYTVTRASEKNGTVMVKKPVKKTYAKISIPKSVKINGYSFRVTSIGKKAFYQNKRLKKVTIGNGVTTVGKQAFAGSGRLKKVIWKCMKPKAVKKSAFRGIAKKAVMDVPNKKSVLKKYRKLFKKSGLTSSATVK